MRTGGSNFKDASAVPDKRITEFDWLNLPSEVTALSLWDSLHDAQIISVRSNLLTRAMTMTCDIEHLRLFHEFGEGFQFIIQFEGVKSARVLRYAIWPGGCSIPDGLSREAQQELIAEYRRQVAAGVRRMERIRVWHNPRERTDI